MTTQDRLATDRSPRQSASRARQWWRHAARSRRPAGRPDAEPARPRIALALGGGGARGWAHVGVLKALHAAGIPIDLVVGASMGGVVGVLWSALRDPARLEQIALQSDPGRLFANDRTRRAIVDSEPVSRAIAAATGFDRLEDLPMPCALVATDLHSGASVTLSQGPIARAVAATIAIPGVFSPVEWGTNLLVDGGITTPVPAATALQLGADLVIAVNVCADPARPLATRSRRMTPLALRLAPYFLPFGLARRLGALEVWVKSSEVVVSSLAQAQLAGASNTLVIRPDVGHFRSDEFDRHGECIALGEAAAHAALPLIQAALTTDSLGR